MALFQFCVYMLIHLLFCNPVVFRVQSFGLSLVRIPIGVCESHSFPILIGFA